MKIYTCNCLFDASLLAIKYKVDFVSFKNKCCSMSDSETLFYYDGEVNTCYVSCLKFVWQELVCDCIVCFIEALENVCICSRLHFFEKKKIRDERDCVYKLYNNI